MDANRGESLPPAGCTIDIVRHVPVGELHFRLPPLGINRLTGCGLGLCAILVAANFRSVVEEIQLGWDASRQFSVKMFALGIFGLLIMIPMTIGRYRIELRPNQIVKQLRIGSLRLLKEVVPWKTVKSCVAKTTVGLNHIQIYRTDGQDPMLIECIQSKEDQNWLLGQIERYRAAISRNGD